MAVGAGFKPAPTSHIGHRGGTLRREKGGAIVFRIVMGRNGNPDTMVILASSDSRFEKNVVAAVRAASPAVRIRHNMADTIDGLSLRCEVMFTIDSMTRRRRRGSIAVTIKGGATRMADDDEGMGKSPDIIDCVFIVMDRPPGYDTAEFRRKIIYPEIARRNGIEGRVEVAVLIDRHGAVSEIRDDAGGNPMLNEAVSDAIRRTAFIPAIRHTSSVDMWIVIPVLFSLSNQAPGVVTGGE